MNCFNHKIIAFIVAMLSLSMVSAQEAKMKRANKIYSAKGFINASEVYLNVAKKGYRSEELLKKLANSYYFNAYYKEAEKWYSELFKLNKDQESVYFLRYTQTLKAVKKDSLASVWYNKFMERYGQKTKDFENSQDYMDVVEKASGRYDIKLLNINSPTTDFGMTYAGNDLVFTSARDTGVMSKRRSAWTGQPFLDLYQVQNSSNTLGTPKKIPFVKQFNTTLNESSAVFTNGGKTMYFTANNVTSRFKDKKEVIKHLKIYRATFINGEWGRIEDLSINGDNYSTAHPAISPKGDRLYFASNRPGGEGETDLYWAPIFTDGKLGEPVNLGEKVNTKGREAFPYITKKNELYFASDGHLGLGGYDVFYLKLKGKGYVGKLINIGKPVNSGFDDFAFIKRGNKGYFSSNRDDGKGHDDIYSFLERKSINEVFEKSIEGLLTDENKMPLKGVVITVLDKNGNILQKSVTDANRHNAITYMDYDSAPETLRFEGANLETKEIVLNDDSLQNNALNKMVLKTTSQDVKTGIDLANILNIKIYFEFNKFNINKASEVELQKIVEVLKMFPELKIVVKSYTDSRGKDNYNLTLSNKRVEATIKYLTDQGIDKNRLSGKGYGSTQLVNKCKKGVPCTPVEHAANRRSEFIVVN